MNWNVEIVEALLVMAMLLNLVLIGTRNLKTAVTALAAQGWILGLIYPLYHWPEEAGAGVVSMVRLLGLTLVMVGLKGIVIPRAITSAAKRAGAGRSIESSLNFFATLLFAAIGTAACLCYARTLPLLERHSSTLIVPASLATALSGFVVMTTRPMVIMQVLGYLLLENGIFIFGLLLVDAVPILVELGVLLDIFVGVFVMVIIIHQISRTLPAASSEHLVSLKE